MKFVPQKRAESHKKEQKAFLRGACDYPWNESRPRWHACTQDALLKLNDWILFICFNPYNQLFSNSRFWWKIITYTFHNMHSNLTDERPVIHHPRRLSNSFSFYSILPLRALKFHDYFLFTCWRNLVGSVGAIFQIFKQGDKQKYCGKIGKK
jgi:hypothetical protein